MIHVFALTISPIVTLTPADAFHVFSVLRIKTHERLHVVHQGQAYLAEVTDAHRRILTILEPISLATEPLQPRILYAPLIKGEKLEWTIQKAVELGITSIQLYKSRFTVVDWHSDQWSKKAERLQKIIHEACMQSHRLMIPTLIEPKFIEDLLVSDVEGSKLIALDTERHRSPNLSDRLQDVLPVHVIIGPEGGFDDTEINLAKSYHWHPFSLGNRILRSETAIVASLAIVEEMLNRIK